MSARRPAHISFELMLSEFIWLLSTDIFNCAALIVVVEQGILFSFGDIFASYELGYSGLLLFSVKIL